MATTAKIAKTNKKPKFSTQHRNRCSICGRPRAFLRKFGLCRLCFRGLALKGEDTRGFEEFLVEKQLATGNWQLARSRRVPASLMVAARQELSS